MPAATPAPGPETALPRRARDALAGLSPSIGAVVVFSLAVNALMMTGPLFMLQVYDRVLASRSHETLAALFLLVAFLYGCMGLLDHVRGRVMQRVAARLQARLEPRLYAAAVAEADADPNGRSHLRARLGDLDAVQQLLASPVAQALFDLPVTPLMFFAIFLFHPLLGLVAVAGGVILVLLALAKQILTRGPNREARAADAAQAGLLRQAESEAELQRALGMRGHAEAQWRDTRAVARAHQVAAGDAAGAFATASKTLRLFLQSAMLAVGAMLVIDGAVTPGVMIASSIVMGRALAPVDVVIGQWGLLQAGIAGWRRIAAFLTVAPLPAARQPLPRPAAELTVTQAGVRAADSNRFTLRGIDFGLAAGEALGVIGASGAGKTTLARLLTGAVRPHLGEVRLGGATLDQYDEQALSRHIGYLPQQVTLCGGTVAANIARMDPDADREAVIGAARAAHAHDLILSLPQGYDTTVDDLQGRLAGGELQRIGLARALYGDPAVLVLDEPNASLDADGTAALNRIVREAKAGGRAVVLVTHRPAALRECDRLLVLDQGTQRALGPRDSVLRGLVGEVGGSGPQPEGAAAADEAARRSA